MRSTLQLVAPCLIALSACSSNDPVRVATDTSGDEDYSACKVDDCMALLDRWAEATGLCNLETGTRQAELPASCDNGWCIVPPVAFLMGRRDAVANWLEIPQHRVVLTRAFLVAEVEVTVAQWEQVMGSPLRSRYACGAECPATGLTLFDAAAYCNRLSEVEGLEPCYVIEGCETDVQGRDCSRLHFVGPDCAGYRLPSEAEWEAAAGLGRGTCIPGQSVNPLPVADVDLSCQAFAEPAHEIRYCGTSMTDMEGCINLTGANGPSCAGPGPTKEFPANALGLFGMLGNVGEFTGTLYRWPITLPPHDWVGSDETDPGFDSELAGSTAESTLVTVRGGSFAVPLFATCGYSRGPLLPGRATNGAEFVGFRPVRTVRSCGM